jgi:hypothetical protein
MLYYTQGENMKCLVCGEQFEDGWDHVLKMAKEDMFLVPRDKAHADYMKEVVNSGYKKPCFCGGKIMTRVYSEDSWEISCGDCNFLWDED